MAEELDFNQLFICCCSGSSPPCGNKAAASFPSGLNLQLRAEALPASLNCRMWAPIRWFSPHARSFIPLPPPEKYDCICSVVIPQLIEWFGVAPAAGTTTPEILCFHRFSLFSCFFTNSPRIDHYFVSLSCWERRKTTSLSRNVCYLGYHS